MRNQKRNNCSVLVEKLRGFYGTFNDTIIASKRISFVRTSITMGISFGNVIMSVCEIHRFELRFPTILLHVGFFKLL